ncbi:MULTISPECIES: tol-pal system YbgF family protein [unclassified Gilliamella]|uniref:tetratricopeptide repeat protein n=1 Tax=unclassified Gilliamella TaxID=2685620 RepID=UPI0013086917|nr:MULTISPECIES: tetratricopeptide repeat protein [unclassified Gilliamella]MWP49116.1 tetratricopeptide repeat protein [Gilliamella sp. Lep-s35]MWP69270.1 tetratricopeptide repeat protein [Gilliamella sp. Lep-s5]MWP76833.1 tetratricopeptide repeat protein [Gilliamella sp. Lep-s21]
MELSDELYDQIVSKLEQGDQYAEAGEYNKAIEKYESALNLVPLQKENWEVSLHIYTAMADSYFNLGNYQQANNNYEQALKCPDGLENGYVWLGLGETYYELENMDKAKDALMSAYMLEGKEIFQDEDDKYFSLIQDSIG